MLIISAATPLPSRCPEAIMSSNDVEQEQVWSSECPAYSHIRLDIQLIRWSTRKYLNVCFFIWTFMVTWGWILIISPFSLVDFFVHTPARFKSLFVRVKYIFIYAMNCHHIQDSQRMNPMQPANEWKSQPPYFVLISDCDIDLQN